MNSSSYPPPGPREPDFNGLPNSTYPPIPPFFRNRSLSDKWEMKPPLSQSRPYVSPDPSPLEENFQHQHQHQQPNTPLLNRPIGEGMVSLSNHPREFPYYPLPHPSILNGRPQPSLFQNNKYFTNPPHPIQRPLQGTFWQHNQNSRNNGNGENDPWFNPIMLPQQNKPKKNNSKNAKKAEGKQPTFLTKLFGILDQPEYHHIIRWDETGEAIIIENPEELADKILPVVYRQSRFASFSRQLNIYGFNRKLSLRHVERGICDPDASTWSHPFLNKFSTKNEILSFKRRVPPRPTQAQKRRMSLQGEGLSPTSSEHSIEFHSPPDAYQHHLLPDVDEEKPIIFQHPRGSLLSQDPHTGQHYQPSFHAPPPDYFAYEQKSPTPLEFDYSNPNPDPEEENRRFHQSQTQKPFDTSRELFKVDPSIFFNGNIQRGSNPFSSSGNSLNQIPQSAPANTTSFPIPIKVTQQHLRTRSVQGEPPSAMLYSPSSPYNTTSWLTGEVPEPQNYMKQEEGSLSISPTALSQNALEDYSSPEHEQSILSPENTAPWPRRDFGNLAGNSNFNLLSNNPRRIGSSPQSLPTDFGSSHTLPQIQNRPQAYDNGQEQPMNLSSSPPSGFGLNTQSFSALSPDSPSTISPGIYQSGFSFPPSISENREYTAISPSISTSFPAQTSTIPLFAPNSGGFVQMKSERRGSFSFSPYSPRNKHNYLSNTLPGNLRTISSRRGSPAPISGLGLSLSTNDIVFKSNDEKEALPSASIKFEEKHPFEGILGGEEISE